MGIEPTLSDAELVTLAVMQGLLGPLLGPLPSLDLTRIHWVILGGESGTGARPMDLGWVRDLISHAVRPRCL